MTRQERVLKAFRHETPDRTPLFEIFQPFHPIHWEICGLTIGSHMGMHWDAMADGVDWEELVDAQAQSAFAVNKFFGVDMVRLPGNPRRDYDRPRKLGPGRWERGGKIYVFDERTKLVILESPAAYSKKQDEDVVRRELEEWNGSVPEPAMEQEALYQRVRELSTAEGIDWLYMKEIGAGTGAAFYPPFLLMWLILEPDLFQKWLARQKAHGMASTRRALNAGYDVIALGGDVSSDKGPVISPDHYRHYLLPVIQEQTKLIHDHGKLAVYTSDGNHWQIYEEMFFKSGVDGYKEVDFAAGMTYDKIIEAGIDRQVCILGNMDARYVMCLGSTDEVALATRQCLEYGLRSPGGHILHLSHSVHEDVRTENYYTMVNTYRECFGMQGLTKPNKNL